jgi:DNA topoisomerase-2
LVNGSKGIGTGFSTDIMCYHPLEIIGYLKSKLGTDLLLPSPVEFKPYWEGFKGTVEKIQGSSPAKYLIKGLYEKVGTDKIRVTELPVSFWTEKFKEHLESLLDPVDKAGKKLSSVIKDYDDMSKDVNVDFTITFAKGKIEELEAMVIDNGCNALEKLLKLYKTNSSSNMHLFDANDKLKKYENVQEIIDDYFGTRLELYQKRKEHLIHCLNKELVLLSNKKRYILENLDGTIDLRRKSKQEIHSLLKERGYDVLEEDELLVKEDSNLNQYKYLVKMPMDSVSQENVNRLEKDHANKETELKNTMSKTIQQMWLEELDHLRREYLVFKEERVAINESMTVVKKTVKKTGDVKKSVKSK